MHASFTHLNRRHIKINNDGMRRSSSSKFPDENETQLRAK